MKNLTKHIVLVDSAVEKFESSMAKEEARLAGLRSVVWLGLFVIIIGFILGIVAAGAYFFFGLKNAIVLVKVAFGVLCLGSFLGFVVCVLAAVAVPSLYAVCTPINNAFEDRM